MRPPEHVLRREAEQRALGAKTCRECGQVKALGEFGNQRRNRDGLHARCKQCVNARNRTYTGGKKVHGPWLRQSITDNARYQKTARVKSLYGMTLDEYEHLLSQGCHICGEEAKHMDHCHDEGHVRGPLCSQCNTGLGQFQDSPDLLIAAAFYLLADRAPAR